MEKILFYWLVVTALLFIGGTFADDIEIFEGRFLQPTPTFSAVDKDVQTDVTSIWTTGKDCLAMFRSLINRQGSEVLKHADEVGKTTKSQEIAVDQMTKSVHKMETGLVEVRDKVLVLQTDINSAIETVRGREKQKEAEIANKRIEISKLEADIGGIGTTIEQDSKDAANYDTAAATLDQRAAEIDEVARKKRKKGKWGIVGAIAGIALAPFTGGASLTLTAAGIGTAGINLDDASDCRNRARQLRNDANTRRQEAHNLRVRKASLEERKTALADEIRTLESSIANLETVQKALQDVKTNVLFRFLTATNDALDTFQTLETVLHEAKGMTKSMEVIQTALSNNPSKLGEKENKYISELKDVWAKVKRILTPSEAQRGGLKMKEKDEL